MYYVTLQHGGAFPHEIERLWCTVASVKRNVIPILEFLISRGLQEMNAQARPHKHSKLLLSQSPEHFPQSMHFFVHAPEPEFLATRCKDCVLHTLHVVQGHQI